MNITNTGLLIAVVAFVAATALYAAFLLWQRRLPGQPFGNSVRAAMYPTRYATALEYPGVAPQGDPGGGRCGACRSRAPRWRRPG